MNMKILVVVTSPSIYHSCSTWKTLWEGNFTGEEKLSSAMNMKNCGHWNVRKQRDIKSSDNYVTLDILLKVYSLEKMKITSSESKDNLGRSGEGLITYLVIKSKVGKHKYKKARYAIGNVSKKECSKIIRKFEKYLMKLMKRRGPNMSLLTVTFTSKIILWSAWWKQMPSTCTFTQ